VTTPIFRRDGDAFVPTEQALGPWDPNALHGGGPAALIADAIQRLAPQMQLARITYEFLGPVPAVPLRVDAQITKPGGRLQLAEATVSADGRPALRASATLLRRADLDLEPWASSLPAAPPADPAHSGPPSDEPGFHRTGMTIRFANGTAFDTPGPAQTWFALQRDLVEGEPLAPAARVAAAADFGNGVSAVLDWDEWVFINCDLTVSLVRDPATPWVLLDAVTQIDPAGIGIASSTLYDEHGPIGSAHQTLFVAPAR
jgi:hypothetical protein